MYILYHNPFSQHARRVVALMEEAGLEYDLHNVNFAEGEHMSPAYLELNPNHQAPTLLDGNFALYESNAILRYLCVKHGLDDWLPREIISRGKTEQWLDWNQCQMSPAVINIVLNSVFLGDKGDQDAVGRGKAKLEELTPILSRGLDDDIFLTGGRPTIADLSVASNITQLDFASAVPADRRIKMWYERVLDIPGFAKALPPNP